MANAQLIFFQQFMVTSNGISVPATGYQLYSYNAGTTTLKPLYQSSSGSSGSAHTNPIILNNLGYPNDGVGIWGQGYYKIVLMDPNNNIVWTIDNVSGGESNNGVVTFSTPYNSGYALTNGGNTGTILGQAISGTRSWTLPDCNLPNWYVGYAFVNSATQTSSSSTFTMNNSAVTNSTGIQLLSTSYTAKIATDPIEISGTAIVGSNVINNPINTFAYALTSALTNTATPTFPVYDSTGFSAGMSVGCVQDSGAGTRSTIKWYTCLSVTSTSITLTANGNFNTQALNSGAPIYGLTSGSGSSAYIIVILCKDTTVIDTKTVQIATSASNPLMTIPFHWFITGGAGDTAAHTYSIRVAASSGTYYTNYNGSNTQGSTNHSTLLVREFTG